MGLLYATEHTTCYHYATFSPDGFKLLNIKKGDIHSESLEQILIFIVLKGELTLTAGNYFDKNIGMGQMILLSVGDVIELSAKTDCECISCYFLREINLCTRYSLSMLKEYSEKVTETFNPIPIREVVNEYLQLMVRYLQDGLSCVHLHEAKKQELFLLLRAYYTKEELGAFFKPIIGKDFDFKSLVLVNYHLNDSVDTLANKLNMTKATFSRRFREHFGESVHQWLIKRKAECVIRDIKVSVKSFQEISDEYGFSSLSNFSKFCTSFYGEAPSKLRKQLNS